MQRTMEIPRQGWFAYFEGLSRRALSHPLRIEVETQAMGDQELVRDLPLMGIELETKGSEVGSIDVALGQDRPEFTHHIDAPERIYVMTDAEGNLECLNIEDGTGSKTLIFFEGETGVPAWGLQGSLDAEQSASAP